MDTQYPLASFYIIITTYLLLATPRERRYGLWFYTEKSTIIALPLHTCEFHTAGKDIGNAIKME